MPAAGADRLLIVNADDYALTPGVSEGILRAHDRGIVTSTSVLAVGRDFDRAVPLLARADIGVGVHLALIGEDPPLLSSSEIPTLAGRLGFRRSWREFSWAVVSGRVDPDDIRREFAAQVDRCAALGRRPTHLDTHQHLHLLAPVSRCLFEQCRAHGIPALRVPRGAGRSPRSVAVRLLGTRLAERARAAGLRFTESFLGLEQSGHLTRPALTDALGRAANGGAASVELGVHPGMAEDPDRDRFRWGFEWPAELAALCSPAARAGVEAGGLRLGTYADLG